MRGNTPDSLASTQLFIKLRQTSPLKDTKAAGETTPSIDVGWINMVAAFDDIATPRESVISAVTDGAIRRRRRSVWIAGGVCLFLVLGLVLAFSLSEVSRHDREPSTAVPVTPARHAAKSINTNQIEKAPPKTSIPHSLPVASLPSSSLRAGGPGRPPPATASQSLAPAEPVPNAERLSHQQAYRLAVQVIEEYRNQGNQFDRLCRNLGARGAYIFDITLDADAHVADVYVSGQLSDSIRQCITTAIKGITFPKQLAMQRILKLDIVIGP